MNKGQRSRVAAGACAPRLVSIACRVSLQVMLKEILLLSCCAALQAAESGSTLGNLRFLDGRLALNPYLGVGGDYDSNPNARSDPPNDQWRGYQRYGSDASWALTTHDQVSGTAEVRPTWSSRAENRPDWLYLAALREHHQGPHSTVDAALTAQRDDAYDSQTGIRQLIDTMGGSFDAARDTPGLHLQAGAAGSRIDYRRVDAGVSERDSVIGSTYVEGGPRFGRLTVRPRVTVEAIRYDSDAYQDSDGVISTIGVLYRAPDLIDWHCDVGWQWRRYRTSATDAADRTSSPNGSLRVEWQVDSRTTITSSADCGLEDNVLAQSSLVIGARAGVSYRIDRRTRGSLSSGWLRSEGIDLPPGATGELRNTVHVALGLDRTLRPGLVLTLSAQAERTWARIAEDFMRVSGAGELIARF